MKTFQNRPYPLCDKPVKEFEQSRKIRKENNNTLKRLFKGFGEAYKSA